MPDKTPPVTTREIANRIEEIHGELADMIGRISDLDRELKVLAKQNQFELGGLRETILVVDDSRLVRTLINGLLVGVGYEVFEADSGEAALTSMKSRDIDLLILDIKMEDFDGLELLAAVRDDPEIRDMPVLICTGSRERIDFQKAAKLGVQGAIPKPVVKDRLLQKVREILTADEPLIPEDGDLKGENDDVFDLTIALVQLEGDRKLLADVLYAFIEDCPGVLRRMRQSLQSGALPLLAEEAGKLKLELGNVGGRGSAKACDELARSAGQGDPARTRSSFEGLEKEIGKLWSAIEKYLK